MNRNMVLAPLACASVAAGQHSEQDPRVLAYPVDVDAQIAPVLACTWG